MQFDSVDIETIEGKLNKKAVSFAGDFEISDKEDSWLRYVLNGVLMFYISFGCIETFVSAFNIKHYSIVLFFVMLVLSILYSFMHVNERAHKIGYGCILITYIYLILRGKTIIKSGFASLINETLKQIQDKLALARIKQYTEYVDDTVLAVTMCLIVLGFVLLLVLNILISEYVNAIAVVCITSPIVASCYYFEEKPGVLPIVMYLAGIMGLIVMRLNSKITLFVNKNDYYVDDGTPHQAPGEESIITIKKVKKEKVKGPKKYSYTVANKMHAHLLLVVMVCVTILASIFGVALQNNYKQSMFVTAVLRDAGDELVANIVTDTGNGGSKKAASGGLGRGKLGKVSEVKYDNKIDIKIRFIPTDNDTLYLKGYVGSVYEDNSWKVLSRAKDDRYYKMSKELSKAYKIDMLERVQYPFTLLSNSPTNIFSVENVDGNGEYAYMPYYAELNEKCMEAKCDDEIYMTVNALSYEMRYHPNSGYVKNAMDTGDFAINTGIKYNMDIYFDYIKKMYTNVPEYNKELMQKVCDQIGLKKKNAYTNKDINMMVEKVQKYFQENYIYTLSPGATPNDRDFVDYFIETKKGFCAHFTSAGVMILRHMGIPTRYVEGYAVTNDLIKTGTKVPVEDVAKYTNGYVPTGSSLIEVVVPDNKAHAWIEVYKENFGWVPYEMTYYKDRETKQDSSDGRFEQKISELKEKAVDTGVRLGILAVVIVIIIIVLYIVGMVRLIKKKKYRLKAFTMSNKAVAMFNLYDYLKDVMEFFGIKRERHLTVNEYMHKIAECGIVDKSIIYNIVTKLNEAAYGNGSVSEEDYIYVKSNIENIVKIQYNGLGFKEKIKFKLICNL